MPCRASAPRTHRSANTARHVVARHVCWSQRIVPRRLTCLLARGVVMYYDECLCRRRIAWRLKSIYSRHFDASKTCAKTKTHQHQEQALVLFCFIKHMQGKISPNHRMMVAAAAAALRQIENKFIHIVLRAGQGTRSEQHKGMDKHNKTRAATVIQSRRVAPRRGGSNISPARRAATRYIPSASRRDARPVRQ